MNTSGTAREHLLILVPTTVLLCFTMLMLGGLNPTLEQLNRLLDNVWQVVLSFLRAYV
jgi:hypothetical protein